MYRNSNVMPAHETTHAVLKSSHVLTGAGRGALGGSVQSGGGGTGFGGGNGSRRILPAHGNCLVFESSDIAG